MPPHRSRRLPIRGARIRALAAYEELLAHGGKVAESIRAFGLPLGESDMLAYLAMMAPRLIELHRVLKPTASFYIG